MPIARTAVEVDAELRYAAASLAAFDHPRQTGVVDALMWAAGKLRRNTVTRIPGPPTREALLRESDAAHQAMLDPDSRQELHPAAYYDGAHHAFMWLLGETNTPPTP